MTAVSTSPGPWSGPPGDCPAQDGTDGLRERKKRATRQALGVAAMRLAIERGIDNVRIEDIAALAGVSSRTFSNYFSSKYEAICALALERGRLIGAALRDRPAGEPLWDAITGAVLQQYGAAAEAPDRDRIAGLRLVVTSAALQGEYLRTQQLAQHLLAEAIAERTGADPSRDMRPALLAGAVTAATQVAMGRWIFAEPPAALAPLIRLALRQLADAVAAASTGGGGVRAGGSRAGGSRAGDSLAGAARAARPGR